jgi:type IV secretion system protein VirB6
MLTNCGGDSACIDAEDFGFTKVTVSSRYDPEKIVGTEANQVAPWVDKDLKLSGKPLVIMVKNWQYGEDLNNKRVLSAWCPWWGTKIYSDTLSPFCHRLRECKYLDNETCNSPVLLNAPCLMKRGMGLYADLDKRGADSPNTSVVTMKTPRGVTLHVGEPTENYIMYDFSGAGVMRRAGGVVYNYDGDRSLNSSRLDYVNGKLYFKILDSFYEDNNGQYVAVVKSGLHRPGDDIFELIKRLVQGRLFGSGDKDDTSLERNGIVRTIYYNIITAPGYSTAIRAALILYIMFSGILFLLGSISLTHTEVINRVLKVAIITALFTPSVSWDFFNQYIFLWIYEGSDFIVGILKDAANSGPGDSSILTFLTTPQIMAKLASLLFSTWQGFIYIIIYLIMLIFITMVMFNATVLYLTAQVMIGLLICLAPIFIAFYLFEKTKSFFENWLKQLISYAIQTIIVSAGILFMTLIIRNQIYNTLGFRVCLHEFPEMNIPGGGGLNNLVQGSDVGDVPIISIFSWWFPHIQSWDDKPIKAKIPIPKAHFVTPEDAAIGFGLSNQQDGDYCEAYGCIGERYPDLPFLDPNNPFELRQMNILRSNEVIEFSGLFIIVVCVYY